MGLPKATCDKGTVPATLPPRQFGYLHASALIVATDDSMYLPPEPLNLVSYGHGDLKVINDPHRGLGIETTGPFKRWHYHTRTDNGPDDTPVSWIDFFGQLSSKFHPWFKYVALRDLAIGEEAWLPLWDIEVVGGMGARSREGNIHLGTEVYPEREGNHIPVRRSKRGFEVKMGRKWYPLTIK